MRLTQILRFLVFFIWSFFVLFYFLGANKTEHSLTDDMKRCGSIKLLRKYLFYIFYDKAQVKKSINLLSMICVPFSFCSGLPPCRGVQPDAIITMMVHEVERCSLMTYPRSVIQSLFKVKFGHLFSVIWTSLIRRYSFIQFDNTFEVLFCHI